MSTRRPFVPSLHARLVTCSALGSLLLSSALLVACGGGGGVGAAGTGAGTTVTGFSAGSVTGKGSTIVNGVEFDDSSATVAGEDDSVDLLDDKGKKVRGLSGDDVKLGMEVEIEHGDISCPSTTVPTPTVANCDVTPTAKATRISFGNNSLLAPIAVFNTTAAATATTQATYRFTLLGQQVQTTVSTEFNLGSPTIALGNDVVVEVHGKFDASTGITTATRIEVKSATSAAYTGVYRLRGVLANLATSPTIGGMVVVLTADQKAGLSDGQIVRARLAAATTAPYTVQVIRPAGRTLEDQKGHAAEIEGVVDTSASSGGDLKVNGAVVKVDPTKVDIATLTQGARVVVSGTVGATGTLVATTVKVGTTAPTLLVEKQFLGYTLKTIDNGATFVNTYDAAKHTFEVWTTTAPFELRETVVIVQANDPSGLPATVITGKQGSSHTEAEIAAQTGTSFSLLNILGHRIPDGRFVASKIQFQPKKGV